jgi:hypothetical protein
MTKSKTVHGPLQAFCHSGFLIPSSFAIRASPRINETETQGTTLFLRGFVILLSHPLGYFDPEQIQPSLQNPRGKIAQCQTRAARRFFGFQDGTRFVKCVEAVR